MCVHFSQFASRTSVANPHETALQSSVVRSSLSTIDQPTLLREAEAAKERAATDLQKNVLQNYMEFVVMSKEIARLEDDLILLRSAVEDLKIVASDPAGDEFLARSSDRTRLGSDIEGSAEDQIANAARSGSKKTRDYYELVEGLPVRCLPTLEIFTKF